MLVQRALRMSDIASTKHIHSFIHSVPVERTPRNSSTWVLVAAAGVELERVERELTVACAMFGPCRPCSVRSNACVLHCTISTLTRPTNLKFGKASQHHRAYSMREQTCTSRRASS